MLPGSGAYGSIEVRHTVCFEERQRPIHFSGALVLTEHSQ